MSSSPPGICRRFGLICVDMFPCPVKKKWNILKVISGQNETAETRHSECMLLGRFSLKIFIGEMSSAIKFANEDLQYF
jgi:hypothetical protein